MAHQSLYRRYRSQRFSEVLGQPHVTQGLQSAVAQGRQGHAYLFSGPRGTGKTSTARILAKALNCENLTDGEPCCACDNCRAIEAGTSFDIHELDAASHNKVDDIRDLISKVHLGTPGLTKVYILDEVHMLSPGAENALLKTLEEPPAHVVFVLATTEPQKVVATIRSRTQHFEFHLLPADVLAEHLRWVIADAGLTVSEDGIDFALRQGGGSARDTLSALDLVVAAGGVPEGGEVAELLIRAIAERDPARAIASIQEGLVLGREPRTIGGDALELLRNAFLAAMGAPLHHLNDRLGATAAELGALIGAPGLTRALESIGQALVEMRQAPDPRVPLEVTVLRLARTVAPEDTAGLLARIDALEARVAELEARPASATPASRPTPPPTGRRPGTDTGPPAESGTLRSHTPAADSGQRPPATESGTTGGHTPAADSGRRPPASRTDNPAAPRPASGGGEAGRPPRSPRSGTPGRDPALAGSGGAPQYPPTAPDPGADRQPVPSGGGATGRRAPSGSNGGADDTAGPHTAPGAGTGSGGTDPGPPAAAASLAPAAGPAGGAPLSPAAVNTAWGPLLDGLSQKVRARFKGGQILNVADGVITFGVPNTIARDRCLQVGPELEAALARHFGQPVHLDVTIDTGAAAPIDMAKLEPRLAGNAPSDLDDDIGPVSELADATDQSSSSVERLTRAFPGSEVIDG